MRRSFFCQIIIKILYFNFYFNTKSYSHTPLSFPFSTLAETVYLRGMKLSKWPAIVVALITAAACFFPWVTVDGRAVSIGGFHSTIANYGKPGLLHCFFLLLCIVFLLVSKVWSVRTAFFVSAVNIAWALRNFFLISSCQAGECPTKQPALYVILIGSILLTLLILAVRVLPGRSSVNSDGSQGSGDEVK